MLTASGRDLPLQPGNRRPRPRYPGPVMGWLIAAFGALWIVVIVWDAFEAIVLPGA